MIRFFLALVLVGCGCAAMAQPPREDRPPVRTSSPAPEEQKARQAQKLFARAVSEYRQDRLLDAIKSLEESLKLEAEAVPPRKLLAVLFASVGRDDDAIEQLFKVTAASPDDFDAWERSAALLMEKGESKAAREALRKAVGTRSIQHNPERWLLLLNRLGSWSEKARDTSTAEFALRELVRVLDEKRDAIRKAGVLTLAEIEQETEDALERLGQACLANRRLDDAEAAFARSGTLLAARKNIADAARIGRLHWHQAQVAEARGTHEIALQHLREALPRRPASVEPYRMLVRVLEQLNRRADILTEIEAYARADRKNAGLQVLLAEQYANAGRLNDVQQVFASLLESGPKPEYYRELFRHFEKAGRSDLVLRTLDERLTVAENKNKPEDERDQARAHARAMYSVLRQKPALIRAMLPLAWDQRWREFRERRNLDYRTYEILAQLAVRAGELPAAESLLRESLRSMRGRRWGGWDASIAEALIQVLMAQKKYQDVVTLCEERIQESDDNLFMFKYYQVTPLARLGRIKDALAVNQTAIELGADRNKFITRLQRVEILRWAGQLEDAIKECEAILKEYPQKKETRDAIRALAGLYSAKGEHGRAEQQLRRLHEADPNDAGVCNDLGYQLAEQNLKLDEAEKLIRRALDLDRAEKRRGGGDDDNEDAEDNPAYLDSLAWVLFRKGQLTEARRILEKAVAHADARDDAAIWDHLGDVCYRLGDTGKAREAWARAKQNTATEGRARRDGRFDEIHRKLQALPNK